VKEKFKMYERTMTPKVKKKKGFGGEKRELVLVKKN